MAFISLVESLKVFIKKKNTHTDVKHSKNLKCKCIPDANYVFGFNYAIRANNKSRARFLRAERKADTFN